MREAQLKQGNKTLRDELRKVQSSAALLERQRNPGVGYWGTRGTGDATTNNGSTSETRVSVSSPSPADVPSRASSPAPSTAGSTKDEEEVNLEYIRNVILQFLEHKEMRVCCFFFGFLDRNIVTHSICIPASLGESPLHYPSFYTPRNAQVDSKGVKKENDFVSMHRLS